MWTVFVGRVLKSWRKRGYGVLPDKGTHKACYLPPYSVSVKVAYNNTDRYVDVPDRSA